MKRWSTKPLGEFIEERTVRLGRESATIYSVTNERGFVPSLDLFDKQVFSADTGNYKCVGFHDLAYNPSRINVGSVAMCEDKQGGAVSPMYVIVRCKSEILPRYLLHFLKSDAGLHQIRHRCEGAVRFQLKFRDLSAIPILAPSLAEQERIVKLLDEADELRKLRAQTDRRTAAIVPGLFHEMFGGLPTNPNRWPVKQLWELVAPGDKINYGVVQPGDEFRGGVPIVRVGDFENMTICKTHLKRIDPAIEAAYRRSRLVGDEVLLACVGATIGKVALADDSLRGFNIVRAVARIRCGPFLVRSFLAWQLVTSAAQAGFGAASRTVAQATLNIKQIEETRVLVPPLPLQKEFAQRVAEIRALEIAQATSRQRLEALFQSMLHRAFNGEF